MDLHVLRDFFMWCSIINIGMLWFSFLICGMAGNMVYRLHGRWFPMPREKFNVVIYAMLGFYKIVVLVFNVVPFVVLWIVG